MTHITLTSDQTAQLAAATDDVVIADSDGKVVAKISAAISDEEAEIVAEAKRRLADLDGARPFSEVIADLKSRYGVDGPAGE